MAIASDAMDAAADQRPWLRLVVDAPSPASELGCDPGVVICSCRTHSAGPAGSGSGGIAGRREPRT